MKLKSFIYFLIVIIIINIFTSIFYYNNVTSLIDKQQFSNNYDVGIVFFYDFEENNSLSSETRKRLNQSVLLFNERTIENIICVGGTKIKQSLFRSRQMRKYLFGNEIPSTNVFSDSISFSSITNWQESRKNNQTKKLDKSCINQFPHSSLLALYYCK